MTRLAAKVDREPGKNCVHGPNSPKTPTPVHAKSAVSKLYQRVNMLPLQLSSRHHFLKFFSHSTFRTRIPRQGMGTLKVVSGQKPREIAARVLIRRASGVYVEDLLEQALAVESLSPADRRLCQELVYGVVRWRTTLDWLIDRKTQNRQQKPLLKILLRLGLYQLFWLDRIPEHAAVHEMVELARHLGFGQQSGFVNALLRGYLREKAETRQALQALKVSDPPTGFSHPQWAVARWLQRWGEPRTRQLLEWNNTPPKTFARVNSLRSDPGKLLDLWRDEGVDYDFFRRDWLEENLVFELRNHPPLSRLPSMQQGFFYVQDPSTLLAVQKLDPHPGESVLDLCAAPGGKLCYIAQKMANQGRLTANDSNPDRLKLVRQNCARLGVKLADITASVGQSGSPPAFDRILIDAPCSNTGVMRRRVDLRWRVRLEELNDLRQTQLRLLSQASALLKSGGVLVYSTCSLEPEENAELVRAFLQENHEFTLANEQELLPFVDGVDGAYVARLEKSPSR